MLGVGTGQLKKDAVKAPLKSAIEIGFRLVDTARIHENEKEIGEVQHLTFKWTKIEVRSQVKSWAFGCNTAISAILISGGMDIGSDR